MTEITVSAEITREIDFRAEITQCFPVLSGNVYRATQDGGTPYEGPYQVMPKFTHQTLSTKGMKMIDDVTVDPITVSRTSNPSGGKTIYIGGTING